MKKQERLEKILSLGSVIDTHFDNNMGKGRRRGIELAEKWNELMPHYVSEHSQPLKIEFPPKKNNNGTLFIEVEYGFQPEMSFYQQDILKILEGYFGAFHITKLKFTKPSIRNTKNHA